MFEDHFELMRRAFSVLSGLFVFLFYIAVARDALRKVATPNPVSWLIWSLNDTLILCASWSAGCGKYPCRSVGLRNFWLVRCSRCHTKRATQTELLRNFLPLGRRGWMVELPALLWILHLASYFSCRERDWRRSNNYTG